jgi:hypothetical protein
MSSGSGNLDSDSASCDCAQAGGTGATDLPASKVNRAGLPAIGYRVGDYARFRAALLARLGGTDFPALTDLTTHAPDDFTIAFCDAFATVADVLTFYQERIANESYLRTARQRRSLLELAALIGYKLAPGVAAETRLAFTLESAPGAPAQAARPVTIPTGTRVQSVPDAGQDSQTFETVADVDARVDWNAMVPQQSKPPTFNDTTTSFFIRGTAANVAAGDTILIVGEEVFGNGTAGARWAARTVTGVAVDAAHGVTQLSWAAPLGAAFASQFPPTVILPVIPVRVYCLRQRASFFGYNAPDARLIARPIVPDPNSSNSTTSKATTVAIDPRTNTTTTTVSITTTNNAVASPLAGVFTGDEWAGFDDLGSTLQLDAVYAVIAPDSWIVLAAGDLAQPSTALVHADTVASIAHNGFGLSARITEVTLKPETPLPPGFLRRSTIVLAQSDLLPLADQPITAPVYGPALSLDGSAAVGLTPGRVVAIAGKRQRVQVNPAPPAATLMSGAPGFNRDTHGRSPARGESFVALEPPRVAVTNDLADAATMDPADPSFSPGVPLAWNVLDHDGTLIPVTGTPDVLTIAPARKEDDVVNELHVVTAVEPGVAGAAGTVTLQLDAPITTCFDRATVTVNANVAPATHGETVSEVLGSGDGSQPNQSFALKQGPLTYVSSAVDPSGRRSTLAVLAGNLGFSEAPTLAASGPRDRVFTVAQDDGGGSTVTFGDGVEGARLPTGPSNLRATYRKGLGADGNVRLGQLTTLITRPLGVKAVTNPVAAAGGQDPENLDGARVNAPLRVKTIDRAVSLTDYGDFARTFAGIAKAQASLVATTQHRVYVTVAAAGGAALAVGDPLLLNLAGALRRFGDPTLPVVVQSYQPVTFVLSLSLRIDAGNDAGGTRAAVEAALRAAFAFDARDLGQAVTLAEVYIIIQAIPGVTAATVDDFHRSGEDADPNGPPIALAAALPTLVNGAITAGELLTLDPAPVTFGEMP